MAGQGPVSGTLRLSGQGLQRGGGGQGGVPAGRAGHWEAQNPHIIAQ